MSEATNKLTIAELTEINPLIDAHGGTTSVSVVLGAISRLLANADPKQGMPLDYEHSYGLSRILDACSIALDHTPMTMAKTQKAD